MSDRDWDPDGQNRRFKNAALNAWSYLKQCRALVEGNPSYEAIIDEHMAVWLANDYFTDRTFLETREALLSELAEIRDRDYTPSRIYDAERFRRHWRARIDQMIQSFSVPS